ncbi:hypothetical protein ElyMa_003752900 [Elysia marginata]|uniref:Uncharacterized protein n=1 Tax=Elysia marginata TaxID=1093978 RepID=A0AAV4F7B5_9GAST|nr:hypothetical protein ElyMa_003752900 [Elysia marginata]
MVNSWWGLPSTVRSISGKQPSHLPQSHFLHHYLHLKHSHNADRASLGALHGHSTDHAYDSRFMRSHGSKGQGVSHDGHFFVSVRGGGVDSGSLPYPSKDLSIGNEHLSF